MRRSPSMEAHRFTARLAALAPVHSRRAVLRLLGGLGLAGSAGPTYAKKKHRHKRRKCAQSGQPTNKKRQRCCAGLVKDPSGHCASPQCVPSTCPANACGNLPDGCGGTLSCGCPADQICLRSGVCQPCDITCPTGNAAACGAALQELMSRGGTVYVCPGRYQGGFSLTRAVTVIGAGQGDDPVSDTILDGNSAAQVLSLTAAGTVELERLRVSNGSAPSGGGIGHSGQTLRMTDCTVSGNIAQDVIGGGLGGGIEVNPSGRLELLRCTIRDNHAQVGAGLILSGPSHTLTDCLVEANEANDDGGGLFLLETLVTLAGSTEVRGNTAAGKGGGIYVQSGGLAIAESCRVRRNTTATGNGGGIFNGDSFGGIVTLQGPDPSPIVVNNCRENCVGPVAKCAVTPVSC